MEHRGGSRLYSGVGDGSAISSLSARAASLRVSISVARSHDFLPAFETP